MMILAWLRERFTGKATLIKIYMGVAVFVIALLAARSWMSAHDDAIRLAATLEAQKQVQDDATKRQHQRDVSLQATLRQINASKRRVTTPTQAAAAIPSALPTLPDPMTIQIPQPTPVDPEPPAVATIPQADLKPIYNYLVDCQTCQASLAAAKDNLADEQLKLKAITTERDAAVRAAQGGSRWSRLARNTKWFILGAAAAAIASAATAH